MEKAEAIPRYTARRVNAFLNDGRALVKEAKGLGRSLGHHANDRTPGQDICSHMSFPSGHSLRTVSGHVRRFVRFLVAWEETEAGAQPSLNFYIAMVTL